MSLHVLFTNQNELPLGLVRCRARGLYHWDARHNRWAHYLVSHMLVTAAVAAAVIVLRAHSLSLVLHSVCFEYNPAKVPPLPREYAELVGIWTA